MDAPHVLVLWGAALLGGPVWACVAAHSGYHVSTRAAVCLFGVFCVAFGLTATPISLPGHVLDQCALALAWGSLCAAASAAPTRHFFRTGVLASLSIVALPGLFIALILSPPNLSRTVDAGCGHRVRFETWGSVSDSGIAAVVLWQPPWVPVEVQLDRHEFKGDEYPSISGWTALKVVPLGRCGIDVWYLGRAVWRAR